MMMAALALISAPYDLVTHGPQGQLRTERYPSLEACHRARLAAMAEWNRRVFSGGMRQKADLVLERDPAPSCMPAGEVMSTYRG